LRRSILLALGCAAIGFFAVAALLPRTGGRTTGGWGGDLFGLNGLVLGAVGSGLGLALGLALALRRRGSARDASPPTVESTGPSTQVRAWLRKKRRRDPPKRFGKRGN
jgi:hypothetical protein